MDNANKTRTIQYYSDEEFADLKSKYESEKIIFVDESDDYKCYSSTAIKDDTLRARYELREKRNAIDRINYNVDRIFEATESVMNEDVFNYVAAFKIVTKNVNGIDLEFLEIPEGTKFYKGIKYFYSDKSTAPFIWVADKKLACKWARDFNGGVIAYKTNKPLLLLILSKNSWAKLIKILPTDLREIVTSTVYNEDVITMANKSRFYSYKNRRPAIIRKKIPDFPLQPEPERSFTNYIRLEDHKNIFGWMFENMKLEGIISVLAVSPLSHVPIFEEIVLRPTSLEIDKTDMLYWENWSLRLPEKFVLNEQFTNRNFRIVDFYNTPADKIDKPKGNDTRILSFNVHDNKSINLLDTIEAAREANTKFIFEAYADIICLQEVDDKYLTELKAAASKNKFNVHYVENGLPVYVKNKKMYLVVLTKTGIVKPIQYTDAGGHRGFILIKHKNVDIVAAHLPIGISCYNSLGVLINACRYEELYEKNFQQRKKVIDKILEHNPQVIVGDCNFEPDDKEYDYLKQRGYTADQTTSTSVYGGKVDYAFYKGLHTTTTPVNYNMSDHKPILFDFSVVNTVNTVEGGSTNISGEITKELIYQVILLIIIVMVVLMSFGEPVIYAIAALAVVWIVKILNDKK